MQEGLLCDPSPSLSFPLEDIASLPQCVQQLWTGDTLAGEKPHNQKSERVMLHNKPLGLYGAFKSESQDAPWRFGEREWGEMEVEVIGNGKGWGS